jgi:hypothetical protein
MSDETTDGANIKEELQATISSNRMTGIFLNNKCQKEEPKLGF